MATVKEDPHSWNASAIQRRDFRATKNGPEVTGTPKRRKDTKRWCKGKEGREHVIEVRMGKNDYFNKGCRQDPDFKWVHGGWTCFHSRECINCGRIMEEWLVKEDCPTWIRETNEAAQNRSNP